MRRGVVIQKITLNASAQAFVPWAGLEPATCPLTAGDSTIELPGNGSQERTRTSNTGVNSAVPLPVGPLGNDREQVYVKELPIAGLMGLNHLVLSVSQKFYR